MNIEKNSGDLWLIKGIESNALSSYLSTALLQIELKHEVKYILDDIESIIENQEDINKLDYDRLNELMEKLPFQNIEKKKSIMDKYKDKSVYEFVESNLGEGLLNLGFNIPRKRYVKNRKEKIVFKNKRTDNKV